MSRLLVTGGCGFIGSAFVRRAINDGHEVLNYDALTYAANPDNLSSIARSRRYQFIKADICDARAANAAFDSFKPSALINFAAETHVDKSIDSAGDFIKTNIEGTRVLLDTAKTYWQSGAAEFRFLHVSTDEVYGDLGPLDPAFTETTPYAPSSPYAASKAASDHLVRAWHHTYGLPVLITNCSNNYGPYQFPEKLIPLVILKALAGEDIPIYGTGENIRDWLHVDDHVSALLVVLAAGKTGETYNIGGNNERTNIDLVRDICDCLNKIKDNKSNHYEDLITFVPDRPGHDRRYAVNTNKIKTTLGWQPEKSGAVHLTETVKWYIENEKWRTNIVARATRRQGAADKKS